MDLEILTNGCFECLDTLEDATPDALVREFGEEPFDLVEPRSAGWREVQAILRPARKPSLDAGVLWVALLSITM